MAGSSFLLSVFLITGMGVKATLDVVVGLDHLIIGAEHLIENQPQGVDAVFCM